MADREQTIKNLTIILKELSRQPLSRSAISNRTAPKGLSRAVFEGNFRFLIKDGNVEKTSPEHRAVYRLTEKGKKFLAWRGIT